MCPVTHRRFCVCTMSGYAITIYPLWTDFISRDILQAHVESESGIRRDASCSRRAVAKGIWDYNLHRITYMHTHQGNLPTLYQP